MTEDPESTETIANVPPDPGDPPNHSKPTFVRREIDHLVDPDHARKVLLHSDTGKLSVVNPGIVKKFVHDNIGRPDELQRLNTGDLLIVTRNSTQTNDLLALESFCGGDVKVTTPAKWNCVKGVIRGNGLRLMSIDEIIDLSEIEDGIIDVRHFLRRNWNTNQREKSNTAVLTFNSLNLPTHVHIGFQRFEVSLFIPDPMRCYSCQKYGHHISKCEDDEICAKCSSLEHVDKDCQVKEEDYKCPNCQGTHPAWSRKCPTFIAEKRICEYKVKFNVSYYQARKAMTEKTKNSYANAAAPTYATIETQTDLSFLPTLKYDFSRVYSPPTIAEIMNRFVPPQSETRNENVVAEVNADLDLSDDEMDTDKTIDVNKVVAATSQHQRSDNPELQKMIDTFMATDTPLPENYELKLMEALKKRRLADKKSMKH